MTASGAAIRKAFWRIAPWCMLIYVIAYIDRVNVGFAALSMNKELGLTATTFGAANTILFILYTAFEVPSSLLLMRFGIRRWLPCIMIGWGVASACTLFAVDDHSLYGLRGLVGIAEAGLLPGLLYFLGRWFPSAERAKANSLFLASLPLALAVGGPVSGVIMVLDGSLGLSGWRWLFLLEGAPPILMGLAVIRWLPSRPAEARWLSIEEKTALQERLDEERLRAGKPTGDRAWKDILNAPVILLALSYFCVVATVNTIGVWTPQIVKEMIGADASKTFLIGILTAVPPLFAIIGMIGVSWSSDRTGRRVAHHIGVMGAAALGWAAIVLLPTPGLKLAGLSLCALGGFSAFALFWTVSTRYIPHRSQAVGIAAIQSVGNLASITSPLIIGFLRDATHNFYAGAWYMAALLSTGILVVLLVTTRTRPAVKALATLVLGLTLASSALAQEDPILARGRYLATAGNCFSCHTKPGGIPFTGGVAFDTPFGKIYSTNITPDDETGIGRWTAEDLRRALHEGVAPGGRHLFPAFPYTAFAKVTDEDADEIYAYLRSLKAERFTPPGNSLAFSQRWSMKLWNKLFFKPGPFAEDKSQSAEWNRGAYLVEGLGHCGACHSPRNGAMAEIAAKAFAGGTLQDGAGRRWSAVNLTSAKEGLGNWPLEDLAKYLNTGMSLHAGSFGPMNEVIANSLRQLTREDAHAMAVYLKSLPARESGSATVTAEQAKSGETIYKDRCANCHQNSGRGGFFTAPPVAGSLVAQADDPAALINVILYGPQTSKDIATGSWETMKPLKDALSDQEVAAVSNYLRGSWGNRGRPVTAGEVARQR